MRLAASALIAALLMGCGSGGGTKDKKRDQKPLPGAAAEKPELERSMESGPLSIEARDENLHPVWTARAQSATLNVFTDDNMAGALREVDGEIYNKKGKIDSSFTATNAQADRKKKNLKVWGQVVMTSADKKSKITADRLDWKQDLDLVQLIGNVWLKSTSGTAGPITVLWARPDMHEFGTPNMMKKGIDMKILYAALALGPALAKADIEWSTPDEHFQVKGLRSWKAKRIVEDKWNLVGSGNPFTAILKEQGLTITGSALDGTVIKGTRGWYASQSTVSGNAKVHLKQDNSTLNTSKIEFTGTEDSGTIRTAGKFDYSNSSGVVLTGGSLLAALNLSPKGAELQRGEIQGGAQLTRNKGGEKLTASGNSLVYTVTGETATAVLSGNASIIRSSDGATVTLNGSSATAVLRPNTPDALVSADVKGPVTMSYQRVTDGKTTKVNGSANTINYNVAARKITLAGNVIISGNSDALTGSMTGDKVIITLNERGEVTEIEAEAENGTARIKGR